MQTRSYSEILLTYKMVSPNFFPLNYDLYLIKTYMDCSKIIEKITSLLSHRKCYPYYSMENRDLKNFQ